MVLHESMVWSYFNLSCLFSHYNTGKLFKYSVDSLSWRFEYTRSTFKMCFSFYFFRYTNVQVKVFWCWVCCFFFLFLPVDSCTDRSSDGDVCRWSCCVPPLQTIQTIKSVLCRLHTPNPCCFSVTKNIQWWTSCRAQSHKPYSLSIRVF